MDFLQFDLKILESLISFLPHYREVMESERFQLIPRLNEEFLEQNSQENSIKYDIVISLGSDTESFAKLLSDDGILIMQTTQILLDVQKVKMQLESLGDFVVKMPFYAPLSVLQDCYIFASKLYHPTADIQLQRADMLEGLKYYHANLHLSAFVLPKAVRSALLGVAKN